MSSHLGSEPPLPRVGVPLHDDPLDLGHHTVVASGDDGSGHQSHGCSKVKQVTVSQSLH